MEEVPKIFIPPLLASLAYYDEPEIRRLEELAILRTEPSIIFDKRWFQWRGILEYLCFVELARDHLRQFAAAPMASQIAPLARYHSTSLVFSAQATFDIIAFWLKRELELHLKDNRCSFANNQFREALKRRSDRWAIAVQNIEAQHQSFIMQLDQFRRTWIHRAPGGAIPFCDAPPDRGGTPFLGIPIDPSIDPLASDYFQRVQRCRKENSGEWLYPLEKFANRFADGARAVCLTVLRASLDLMPAPMG